MSAFVGLFRLLPLAGGLCLNTVMATAQAQAPDYPLDDCCNICPATAESAAYNTSFLHIFRQLVQGEDGWLFRSEKELTETFGPDAAGYAKMARFAHKLRQHKGLEVVFVYQPTRGLVHADRLPDGSPIPFDYVKASQAYADTLARFRQTGLQVPNLLPLLHEPASEQAYFFKRDHHWSPYGAERTARLVADHIRQMPVYSQLKQQAFVTERTGLIAKNGSLQEAARRICGQAWSNQFVDAFRTGPVVSESVDENALFSDEQAPQVVLVGTSNSKGLLDYNFVGYLKQFLSVDILNEALVGGSFDGSILSYLQSDDWRDSPPNLLIWEVPAYHAMISSIFYRQLIPLVSNGCQGQPLLMESQTRLKTGQNEVLFNGAGNYQALKGRNLVMDIQFSSADVRKLDANVWYLSGRKEHVDMEYAERVPTRGRFVFELRSDGDWGDLDFMSMDIEMPQDMPKGLSVKAQVCQRQAD